MADFSRSNDNAQKFQKRENQETRKKQKSGLSDLLSFKFSAPGNQKQNHNQNQNQMKKKKKPKREDIPDLMDEFPQIGKPIGLIEEHQPETGILENTDNVQKELEAFRARLKEENKENNLKILESIVGTWTLTSSTNVSEYLNGADEESHKKWLQGNVKFTYDGSNHLTWCFIHENTIHDLHSIEMGKFKNGEKWSVENGILKTCGEYPTDRFILDGKLHSFHFSPVDQITCKMVYERVLGQE